MCVCIYVHTHSSLKTLVFLVYDTSTLAMQSLQTDPSVPSRGDRALGFQMVLWVSEGRNPGLKTEPNTLVPVPLAVGELWPLMFRRSVTGRGERIPRAAEQRPDCDDLAAAQTRTPHVLPPDAACAGRYHQSPLKILKSGDTLKREDRREG